MKKLLTALLISGSMMAFADTGGYIGIGAGAGWNDVNTAGAAFRLDGGYKFTDMLAVELGTTKLAQSGSGALNQNLQFTDLSLKYTWKFHELLSLVGQAGGAFVDPGTIASPSSASVILNNRVNQSGWDFMAGLGLAYKLTEAASVTVTDYYYAGGVNYQGNTNLLLAGINYSF